MTNKSSFTFWFGYWNHLSRGTVKFAISEHFYWEQSGVSETYSHTGCKEKNGPPYS